MALSVHLQIIAAKSQYKHDDLLIQQNQCPLVLTVVLVLVLVEVVVSGVVYNNMQQKVRTMLN